MILGAQLACQVLEGEDPKDFLKRVMQGGKRKNMLQVGEEVISGTGDTRDIMEACFDTLKRLDKGRYAAELSDHDVYQYTTLGDIYNDFDPEYYLYERLFNILQKYCPPMTYFGALEADGSIGCWPYDSMAIEELVDQGKLFYVDAGENPAQADAIRRGDFTDIGSQYAMVEDRTGSKELWDTQRFELVWKW